MNDKARVCSTAGGALGLGGFAAALGLCCSVPWAVSLLGVTGAVAFARLAFLLPYALVGAVVLLSFAFWLAYRPFPASDDARRINERRLLRWFVWITALVVGALAIVALMGA